MKNKKPIFFLIMKIVGFVGIAIGIAGVVLTFIGFGDFETNNFMIGGILASFGLFIGVTGLIFGFIPEISKLTTKTTKNIQQENKEDLLAGFSDGLQGLNAEADLYAEGTGIVIEAKLALLDGATDEVINVLKVSFESEETKTAMKESLKEAQKELPELDSMTLKLCDSKGTVLVSQKYN